MDEGCDQHLVRKMEGRKWDVEGDMGRYSTDLQRHTLPFTLVEHVLCNGSTVPWLGGRRGEFG